MVNINTALPASIATPFHPPTEALHHDNLIKPVIPQTEIITSYAKMREDEERERFSEQSRHIIQDESESLTDAGEQTQQQTTAKQRRLQFFSKRHQEESNNESKALEVDNDFKLAFSVIEDKYMRSVTPIPEPTVDYLL